MKPYFIFSFLLAISFVSCQKKGTLPVPGGTADSTVYIAGTVIRPSDGAGVPCYWKEGKRTDLEVPSNAFGGATGIAQLGNDLYVTGSINVNGIFRGVLWKNGVTQSIATLNGQACSSAAGIIVSGSDIYIAGNAGNTPGYWKNGVGVAAEVLEPGQYSFVSAFAVSGTDVYMTGICRKGSNNVAVVWKNGKVTQLQVPMAGPSQYAVSIVVVGKDVYIGGNSTDATNNFWMPVLWKNDEAGRYFPVALAQDTRMEGRMEVKNGEVYSTGYFRNTGGKDKGCYWKNEQLISIDPGVIGTQAFRGQALRFINNSVGIAGFFINTSGNRQPVFWKNGVMQNLEVIDANRGGYPYDIFIGK